VEKFADMDRRVFLRTAAAGTAGVAAWSLLGSSAAEAATTAGGSTQSAGPKTTKGPAAQTLSFNAGWLFGSAVTGSDLPDFDDSSFATVTLPHTVTQLDWQNWNPATWEQIWSYRKHFDAPAGFVSASGNSLEAPRVFLDFAAAMTGSTVTLNGTQAGTNIGGYLPFSVEVTGLLQPRDNVLSVTLDSTFNIDVPPDRPTPYISADVDFWQPGGIYRDVDLRAVPQIFISDVFAQPQNVLDVSTRQVSVQATVDAAVVPSSTSTLTIAVQLLDPDDGNKVVATATAPVSITATGETTATATITDGLADITLWDTENPKLYTVVTTLEVDGQPLHDYQVRTGVREAVFTTEGFFLNGVRTKIIGLDRHQFFPFAGGAQPLRVEARDAYILRKVLNCNGVRGSHYPQSEGFYDAADELGLLCWEEIPGWGYFGDTAWAEAEYDNVTSMIVRDRNHPSIVIWGSMPNEAGTQIAWYTEYNDLAHELDPSRQTGGDNTYSSSDYVFDVFSMHDYSSITTDGIRWPTLQPPTDVAGKPYLVCEAIGTLSGPAIYYRRIDTQFVQQSEAIAHAIVQNINYGNDAYNGVLAWAGFDYPSGDGNIYQGTKYVGVVDLFRIPKPGAAIYQAQIDPGASKVILPAFYWDFGPTSPVTSLSSAMICSNLDELEVYVGGDLFATLTPDTTDYGNLPYPPSFTDFSAVDGTTLPELRIDGYLNGVKVAEKRFDADPTRDRLAVEVDDAAIDATGSDATRVQFRAVDSYGNPRPYVEGLVTLTVDGPGVIVGDNPLDFGPTGGVGAVWIRSLPGSPGKVTVRASHPALGEGTVTITVNEVPNAPSPVPYGSLAVAASPAFVAAGSSTVITATLTNNGLLELDKLALAVTVPAGWTGTAQTPLTFAGIRSGATVTASWEVTLPADANPGQAPVQVEAVYTGAGQRGVTYQTVNVLSSYATLAAAFNNAGISDDSDVTEADFDGVGNSYSAQALTAAGLAPGATVVYDGITFTWPDVQPGEPDNVVAEGQTILLSGSGTTLGVLGSASPTETASGTVYYTDGSTSTFSITLDNYFDASTGNDTIATLSYVNDSNPATAGDDGAAGQRNQTVYIFYTSAPLTAGKTVQAITLPTGGSIPSSGRITGQHIFALGIGPLNASGQPIS
jgi:beta-galactosidase